MQDSTLDTQYYRQYLDNLLLELKDQLNGDARTLIKPVAGLDSLDEYLLELNTYYYKSFHNKFFPHYENIIKEDMRNLLHIGQDEAVLKQNILAVFKQYARLFNQIKYIAALLRRKRKETEAMMVEYQKGREERNVNLLYVLKEMVKNWNYFLTFERNLQLLLEDTKLLAALNQHPTHAAVTNLIRDWSPDSSREVRNFNRLLADWQLAVKLLLKIQESQVPSKETFESIMAELKKADMNWDNRKIHPAIRTWYQQYIQSTYCLYLDSLSLSEERREHRRTVQTAHQFQEWLNSLLVIIEQTISYKSRGWDHLINQLGLLSAVDKQYLKDLDTYASRLLQSIEELIPNLSSSSRANYQNHSQRASALLAVSTEHLQDQIENKLSSRAILLIPVVEQLRNQNDYLEIRIELLNEKEEHSANASSQCQTIIDTLDAYLGLLDNVNEELNRLLSPRHIKNYFHNVELRIEHLATAAGSYFPSQFKYLIDEKIIETKAADAPEGQILHSEGDIFIFYLDELQEKEIPKIIVAKKG